MVGNKASVSTYNFGTRTEPCPLNDVSSAPWEVSRMPLFSGWSRFQNDATILPSGWIGVMPVTARVDPERGDSFLAECRIQFAEGGQPDEHGNGVGDPTRVVAHRNDDLVVRLDRGIPFTVPTSEAGIDEGTWKIPPTPNVESRTPDVSKRKMAGKSSFSILRPNGIPATISF